MKNYYLLFVFCLVYFSIFTNHTNAQWEQFNGLHTGSINCLVLKGNDLFAGTDNKGVLHSTDNGTTWSQSGLDGFLIQALIVKDTSIFASIHSSTTGYSVFRSDDHGLNWTEINNGLAVNPIVAFAVVGTNLFAGDGYTVYRSTNNGDIWTVANTGLPSGTGYCFAVDGSNLFTAANYDSVYLSTDYGTTWNSISTVVPGSFVSSLFHSGTALFASVYGCPPFNTRGIYVSTDNGANWTSANLGLDVRVFALHGSDVLAFARHGGGSCGQGGGLFKTSDNGTSWEYLNMPASFNCLVSNGIDIFGGFYDFILSLGAWGGVLHSTNDGMSWRPASPGLTILNGLSVTSFAVKDNNLFVSSANTTAYGSIFLSTDDGVSWQFRGIDSVNNSVLCLAVHNGNLLAGTSFGVFRSTDNGISWSASNNGIPLQHSVDKFAVSSNYIYAIVRGIFSSSGVYISTDNGLNWTQSSLVSSGVQAIAVNDSVVLAGVYNEGVYLSTDNGSSWAQINNGLTNLNVTALTISGTTFIASTSHGIFRSTNNGAEWILSPASVASANSFYEFDENIFACINGGGVYLSPDQGENWGYIGDGLGFTHWIADLTVRGEHLFAATSYGVYRRPLSEVTLSQPFPVSPPDYSGQTVNATLKWRNTPDATHYNVQVATDQHFQFIVASDSALTDTTWSIGPLDANVFYHWRVQARNNTIQSPFSVVWHFTTINSVPEQVQLNYPTNGENIEADSVICHWYVNSQFVTHYWFEFATDSLFTNPIIDSTLTIPYSTIYGLVLNTTYWWRVKAKNIIGWGPYSEQWSFIVLVVPVELTSFTASANNNNIALNWSTATETNNQGFEIERLQNYKIERLQEWEKIGFVQGHGTTTEIQSYSYLDKNVKPGSYSYRLKQIDYDGTFAYSNIVEADVTGPKEFTLYQNYPNPFNPSTTIKFALPEKANVTLTVYNMLGEKVKDLFIGEKESGYHQISFDGSNLPSGVFVYRLNAGSYLSTKKMILVK